MNINSKQVSGHKAEKQHIKTHTEENKPKKYSKKSTEKSNQTSTQQINRNKQTIKETFKINIIKKTESIQNYKHQKHINKQT